MVISAESGTTSQTNSPANANSSSEVNGHYLVLNTYELCEEGEFKNEFKQTNETFYPVTELKI
jgi:hypothetical protein